MNAIINKYFFTYSFILFLSCNSINAQEYIVNGTIKDNVGIGLAYANIVFKNDSTLYGVASDSSGNFNIRLNPASYIMSVSLIGYSTQNKKITVIADKFLFLFSSNYHTI